MPAATKGNTMNNSITGLTPIEEMPTELKPCPFCGGEAIYSDRGWGEGNHVIKCTKRHHGCRLCPFLKEMKVNIGKDMLFEIWNTRTDLIADKDATIKNLERIIAVVRTDLAHDRYESATKLIDAHNMKTYEQSQKGAK